MTPSVHPWFQNCSCLRCERRSARETQPHCSAESTVKRGVPHGKREPIVHELIVQAEWTVSRGVLLGTREPSAHRASGIGHDGIHELLLAQCQQLPMICGAGTPRSPPRQRRLHHPPHSPSYAWITCLKAPAPRLGSQHARTDNQASAPSEDLRQAASPSGTSAPSGSSSTLALQTSP